MGSGTDALILALKALAARIVSLSVYPELSDADADATVAAVREFMESKI